MADQPDGVATLLFTDIEGSTALFHELGDTYLEVLDVHHRTIREAIARHRGHEVKTEGDAFFVTFADPVDGVAAAVDAQRALATAAWPHDRPAKVRMGLHRGPVTIVAGEPEGLAIHEAARIADAAHGGQIVVSAAVRDAVGGGLGPDVGLADLGDHGLKDFSDAITIWQVLHPELPETFPPLRSLTASTFLVPAPPTAMIGRHAVTEEVVRQLRRDQRLVTIVGEGGLGKSRLALEVARVGRAWFPDGVFWVPLVDVDDSGRLLSSILHGVGRDAVVGDPLEALCTFFAGRRALLILDNLEQLGDGVVVLAEIVARCADLRMLCTSRTRLRLRAERLVRLDPLGLPTGGRREDLEGAESADLLVARVTDVAEVDLDDLDTAAAVARICELAAGLPLALELAAARADDMSLAEIAVGMADSLDALDFGDRDLLPHQRAMRTAVAWSEGLLTPTDRLVFHAVGLWRGSIDAESVAAATGSTVTAAAGSLHALAAASLLRSSAPDPEGRDRLVALEPIRQYAEEQLLAAEDRAAAIVDGYCEAMAARSEAYEGDLVTADQPHALAVLDVDAENFAAALRIGRADHKARLASALVRFWTYSGRWLEAAQHLATAIESGGGSTLQRAKMGMGAGNLAERRGEFEEALGYLEPALVWADHAQAPEVAAPICNVLATAHARRGYPGDEEAALEWWARAAAHAERSGDPRTITLVRASAAQGAINAADWAGAASSLERCLVADRELGDVASMSSDHNLLGLCYRNLGDHDTAAIHHRSALELARGIGNRHQEAHAELGLLFIGVDADDPECLGHAEAAAATALAIGDPALIADIANVVRGYLVSHRLPVAVVGESVRAVLEAQSTDSG